MRSLWILLLVGLLPMGAMADGLAYGVSGGEMEVRATAQRAVLWLNDGTWELHIQPVFEREAGAAAWVVPFPTRPEVSLGSPELFDQLELLTAPAFLERCYQPCCGECLDGGAGGGDLGGGQGLVVIWEQGSLGELDYVLVSAADGDDAIDWLEANGYGVPDLARGTLGTLAQEGAVFFAARLAADADPSKPLDPVRFRLPDLVAPEYPLRTTAAGVGEGSLGLTLWLIAPADRTWWPQAVRVSHVKGSYPCSPDQFEQALDELFSEQPGPFLALTYRGAIADSERYSDRIVCEDGYWMDDCVPLDMLGADVPEQWAGELDQMATQDALVLRFEGRLSASDMAQDLVFRSAEADQGPYPTDTYTCDVGACYSCSRPDGGSADDPSGGGCGLAATGSLLVGFLLLLGLGLLFGVRQRA